MTPRAQIPAPAADRPSSARQPIADLVFAGEPGGRLHRLFAGAVIVLAIYAAAILIVRQLGRSGASVVAEMAAQIHDAIAAERSVDIKLPPPPPPPPAEPPAPAAQAAPSPAREHVRSVAHHAPAAPAQAGQIAAAADAPLDFTGSAFVVGSGSTYAGGTTTARGTSRAPVTGAVAPNGHGDGQVAARSRAKPVSLDQASWNCPWPAEADARQVDQETVVIRVAVRPDGRVERADVLDDPGFGFGRAARDCALSSRAFAPALDANGAPVGGMSPPIRVHFYR
ncbi:MAG TPA: ferric siderophore ABC transporter substrate-binding protein [Polyangia bacterium]|nr:ferric siderophore ABC transporter substrate-binding protein [Polyangia bacterium]